MERTAWAALNKPKPKVEPPKPAPADASPNKQAPTAGGAQSQPTNGTNGTAPNTEQKPNEGNMEVD